MLTRICLILALVAVLGVGAIPASAAQTEPAAPILDVANPIAGDTLLAAKTVIECIAFYEGATRGVRVAKVRTQNRLGKHRRYRFKMGRLPNWKKAIVTLHEQDRIEFF